MRLRFAGWLCCVVLLLGWAMERVVCGQQGEAPARGAASPEAGQGAGAEAQRAADPAAGHSYHGEAFNEGPRQRAYLMSGTGRVHLPITTQHAEAQAFFDQGLGQLHGFWYFEAERSFRQAAAVDPDCAMAYWGMAMANVNNTTRAQQFMAKAVERKGRASRREQLWIDALQAFVQHKGDKRTRWQNYVRGLEGILKEFPDELEAKAFLCWALWQGRSDNPPGSTFAVDALIGEVLAAEPLHPIHHCRIHLWDYERPQKALESSALCGPSAPAIAHMWHMPGHIYWRLKRYHDAAWQQEASARVDHAHMIRDRVMPYQIHNYAHNNEWLTRSLANIGRVHDAVALAKNMIELPRHPARNTLQRSGSSARYGRTRLLEVLHRYELWDQILALADTMYLEPTDDPVMQVERLRAVGRAHFGRSDLSGLDDTIVQLEQLRTKWQAEQDAAVADAVRKATEQQKPEDEVKKAREAAQKTHQASLREAEAALSELRARRRFADGEHAAALPELEKSGLPREHLAQLYAAAGMPDKAVQTAEAARRAASGEVYPLANYVDIAWRAGKKTEALSALAELRTLACEADLDVPVLQRITPVAQRQGFGADWRLPRREAADLGERPELDSLGPFRWHPSPAPTWTLVDAEGQPRSASEYRGKPVIVIFYLGYGCLHCAEQVERFANEAAAFRAAGIELLAISTDPVPELKKSIDRYCNEPGLIEPRTFPFPLLADPEHATFKQYRAYDDFEKLPLHGTFLIDGQGYVRWQDVSYEPFMDVAFLLGEAQRLLEVPVDRNAVGAGTELQGAGTPLQGAATPSP
jgi:peroxiredoxin